MAALDRLFAAGGPLAGRVSGFSSRPQQLELARAILATLEHTGVLVAEAGTGTGKTFAYLAPALLSGGKVIVSTGTKTLQDQLFGRDLPVVRDALATGATISLLKGRQNYVCLHRLENAVVEARLASHEEIGQLNRIRQFAALTDSGDRAELAGVPEDAGAWVHATSTRENCLGQECPKFGDCFVMRARRNALAADLVVVNHHLFFADVMLRDEGLAELLPACNTVIFDEAHQLPDIARLFFGDTVSTGQLIELARDTKLELRAAGGASTELDRGAVGLDKAARDLLLAVDRGERRGGARVTGGTRMPFQQAARSAGFMRALEALQSGLDRLAVVLGEQAQRSEGLVSCSRRASEARSKLAQWRESEDTTLIRWTEQFGQTLQLHATPLHTGELFRRQMDDHPRAWVFTSATLAVGEDFSHFKRELGIDQAESKAWQSPFDFARQALLYVPRNLPGEPSDPGFTDAVIAAAWPAIRASKGRAFLLFTTLRALRRAQDVLTGYLERDGIDYPLLVQGQGSRSEILARFRSLGNAVLLGSASFWQGVDVRGDALSLVVIDKLPFAPPDDPVLAARIDALRAQGGNPFTEFQLPQAILLLKQGAGRLIRDATDRGVLMVCDPRLFTRPYGRAVRSSLPPMRLTREIGDVEAFFERAGSARIGASIHDGQGRP